MPKPPRRPPPRTRQTDVAAERIAGEPIVAKPANPRQAGLFDLPLPGWMRPCLSTLVDKPPASRKRTTRDHQRAMLDAAPYVG